MMNEDKAKKEARDDVPRAGEDEAPGIVEALLFVSGEALSLGDVALALGADKSAAEAAVRALEARYAQKGAGLRLVRFGDKLQLATRAQYAPFVDRLYAPSGRQTLSQSAIETLSIVAYRQPITRAEIEQIRGVRCEYAVGVLQQKGLIREVGRKEALGRPILYGTTETFLRNFNLRAIDDLPNREELAPPREIEV